MDYSDYITITKDSITHVKEPLANKNTADIDLILSENLTGRYLSKLYADVENELTWHIYCQHWRENMPDEFYDEKNREIDRWIELENRVFLIILSRIRTSVVSIYKQYDPLKDNKHILHAFMKQNGYYEDKCWWVKRKPCTDDSSKMLYGVICPGCGRFRFLDLADYDICPICGWENDHYFEGGGANTLSLSEYRLIFPLITDPNTREIIEEKWKRLSVLNKMLGWVREHLPIFS